MEGAKYLIEGQRGEEVSRLTADYVVSTIPTPDFVHMLSPAPQSGVLTSTGRLGYLAMIVLYIITPDRPLLETSYVYYLERPYHRLPDINKFCVDLCPPEENMLAVEFSCHTDQPLWGKSAQELMELSLSGLEKDGVIAREDVRKVFAVKAASAYPIFHCSYRPHLDKVKAYVRSQPRLALLGRTGDYRYIDSDQCMEQAFSLAEEIARKAG